ncbi:alpha/beta hydrolase [Candidatus Roizmanbacteria bacterium]|nr:alpha/beta hydrolase [Candidatus Roizmanbacteria bacterium]
MKLALLLPGYLDSPDYLHMKIFEKGLKELGYTVERIDPCSLWENGDVNHYTISNYIKQVKEKIESYENNNFEEIILIGHSMGGFTAILAGCKIPQVTKIIALCPPSTLEDSAKKWNDQGVRHSKRDLPDNPNQFRVFDIPYAFVEDGLHYSALEAVKHIHKPLMILIALNDTVVLPEKTEVIVKNADRPYVVRQPNMGHNFRHSEEQCSLVMDEIKKFLDAYLHSSTAKRNS